MKQYEDEVTAKLLSQPPPPPNNNFVPGGAPIGHFKVKEAITESPKYDNQEITIGIVCVALLCVSL